MFWGCKDFHNRTVTDGRVWFCQMNVLEKVFECFSTSFGQNECTKSGVMAPFAESAPLSKVRTAVAFWDVTSQA